MSDSRHGIRMSNLALHHTDHLEPSPLIERAGPAQRSALALTAAVHGLVRLELAGTLGSNPRSIGRRWHTTVLATVRGLKTLSGDDAER